MKPCPFCGSSQVRVESLLGGRNIPRCDECLVIGPTCATVEIAISEWNRRPLEDALAAERDALRQQVRGLQEKVEALEGCLDDIRFISLDQLNYTTVESLNKLIGEIYALAASEQPLSKPAPPKKGSKEKK